MAKKRNYRHEYEKFQSSPKAKKDRAKRNRDRARAEREGRVRKGDGMEVDHPDGIDGKRTRVISRRANRRKGKPGTRI